MPDQIGRTISCIFIAFVRHTLRFGHFISDPMIPRQPEKLMLVICKRRYQRTRERKRENAWIRYSILVFTETPDLSPPPASHERLVTPCFLDNKNPCFMYVNKCRSVALFFFPPPRCPARLAFGNKTFVCRSVSFCVYFISSRCDARNGSPFFSRAVVH